MAWLEASIQRPFVGVPPTNPERVTVELADKVVKAPVEAVVAPTAVELMPVDVVLN